MSKESKKEKQNRQEKANKYKRLSRRDLPIPTRSKQIFKSKKEYDRKKEKFNWKKINRNGGYKNDNDNLGKND